MVPPSSLVMTIDREPTPDDIREIVDNIFTHLDALRDIIKRQRRLEKEVKALDKRLRNLESDVIMLVMEYKCNDFFYPF